MSVTDGAWSSPTTVGSLGDGLGGFDLAALSTNESAIVWGTQVGTSSTYELKSAYFDNTAPTLGGFTTANLVATKPASFSVTTSDRWTTAPTVTWDFDDGTTGTGTNPTHTYALPGNYRVTITTTDEFGNSTLAGAADHGGLGTGQRWVPVAVRAAARRRTSQPELQGQAQGALRACRSRARARLPRPVRSR